MEDVSDRLPPPHLINHRIIEGLITSIPMEKPMSERKIKTLCQKILAAKNPASSHNPQQGPAASAAVITRPAASAVITTCSAASASKQASEGRRRQDHSDDANRQPRSTYNDFGRSFHPQQYPHSMLPPAGQPHIAYDHSGRSFHPQQYPHSMPPAAGHIHQS
ncbi:hypothetical protein KCU93_g10188, partial [Aureobasidium melanogenum]